MRDLPIFGSIREQKNFPIRQWWEVGKTLILVFCQQYISVNAKRIITEIEQDIKSLEQEMTDNSNSVSNNVLKEKTDNLSLFFREKVKGALVRYRFTSLNDMDAPIAFFF